MKRAVSSQSIKRHIIGVLQHADPLRREMAGDILARIDSRTKVMAVCLHCANDCKVLTAKHVIGFQCFVQSPLLKKSSRV